MNVELQQKVVTTRAELQSVKAQAAALQRQKQLAALTQTQVHAEQPPRVWQGVGKAFVRASVAEYDASVGERQAALDAKLDGLAKRETYLGTTLEKLVLALQTMNERS